MENTIIINLNEKSFNFIFNGELYYMSSDKNINKKLIDTLSVLLGVKNGK